MEMPSARCIHNPYHQMCSPVPGTTALTGAIHTWKQGVNEETLCQTCHFFLR